MVRYLSTKGLRTVYLFIQSNIHNENHAAENQTAVLLFSRKLQTHYLLVLNNNDGFNLFCLKNL